MSGLTENCWTSLPLVILDFLIYYFCIVTIKVGKLSKNIMKIWMKQSSEISTALKYSCMLYDHLNT